MYDGYIGLATWQPAASNQAVGAEMPMSLLNFDKTLRPGRIAAGATRDMIKGRAPDFSVSDIDWYSNVHPDYPAKIFTMSMTCFEDF